MLAHRCLPEARDGDQNQRIRARDYQALDFVFRVGLATATLLEQRLKITPMAAYVTLWALAKNGMIERWGKGRAGRGRPKGAATHSASRWVVTQKGIATLIEMERVRG